MTQEKTHHNAKDRLDSLANRAEMGGGPKAIERHHKKGKLTARERLDLLFDGGSFVEVNKLAESQSVDFGMQDKKVPGDGVVTGYGNINKRLVFAYAQDVTVLGGSVGTIHGQKICRIMDEAIKVKAPLVALNDTGRSGYVLSQYGRFGSDSSSYRYDGLQRRGCGLFSGIDRFYCDGKRAKPYGHHGSGYYSGSHR
jgi:acetyl-CoA carboxylase carboxyltransferase component